MAPDNRYNFTTTLKPIAPTVWPSSLTIGKGSTGTLSIDFGQGLSIATGSAITTADATIAAISRTNTTSPGATAVTELQKGTTDITVTFNDETSTLITIPVTVNPVVPLWLSGSALTAQDITYNSVVLKWTAAQDITAVTEYRIYQHTKLP